MQRPTFFGLRFQRGIESTACAHFFVASAFRPVWPGRCDLRFLCSPQSTRALDQGGVEPQQAVSPEALRPWTIPLRYSVGWKHCLRTVKPRWNLGGTAAFCPYEHETCVDVFSETLRLRIVKPRWNLGETSVYIAICILTLKLVEKGNFLSLFLQGWVSSCKLQYKR